MFLNLKQDNTSPVATQIKETIVAGSNIANANNFSTKMVEMLFVPTSLRNLVRYFLTKSQSGIVSLHCMVPYQRISLQFIDNKPRVQRPVVFVALNCNKNEYDTKDSNVHVISESGLAMSELSFNSESTYNGVVVVGSPIENHIPYSSEIWNQKMNNSDKTIGEVANAMTLNAFFNLQEIARNLANEDLFLQVDTEVPKMAKIWNDYIANEQKLIEKGILVTSNLIYADSCALAPVTHCFQITQSQNKYLNAPYIYGSKEAGASFAPVISVVCATGTITPTEVEEVSGYKYGQFAVNSKKGEVIAVPEEMKATTLETCTREIVVYDGSGRSTTIQATLNDLTRNNDIVKRSSSLASVPTGTTLKINGKLSLRNKKAGCLAVNFRVSIAEWTTDNRASSTEINQLLTTSETNMYDEEDFEALLTQGVNTETDASNQTDTTSSVAELEAPAQEQPSNDTAGNLASF